MFLGIILFVSSLMAAPWVYIGQPLPPNSTWGKMQGQMENFPVFIAPNNAGQIQNLVVINDFRNATGVPKGPWKVVNNLGDAALGGCHNATNPSANWWACLSTPDESSSYVVVTTNTTPASNLRTIENLSEPTSNANNLVLSVSATIQCRQEYGVSLPLNVSIILIHANTTVASLTPVGQPILCPVGEWGYATYTWDLNGQGVLVGAFSLNAIYIAATQTNQTVDISYAKVTLVPSNTAACPGGLDGIACNISNFAWTVVNFFVTIATGVIFVFQVLFWFVSLVGIFFFSLAVLFGAGGAPPLFAAPLGILVIGLLFYVAFVIMGKIRGTGNTG